jgi:predicted anti-sigma-YlaC factor YlaD
MDVNVTHAIAANVTLVQSWWVPWIPAFIGVIGAIFGAFAAGIAAYYIEKSKIKNKEFEKRKQIYSRLNGMIALINQIMYLHGESTEDFEYRSICNL